MRFHRGLLKVAVVLMLVAACAAALAFQMTDVGHFTGFALMSATLVLGALYILWSARNPNPDL